MVVTVEDVLAREITYQVVGGAGSGACAPANSSVCNISLAEEREGIYILEIFVGGEQVTASWACQIDLRSTRFLLQVDSSSL